MHIVTQVSTRGAQGIYKSEYVTEFTLDYSFDNKAWMEYINELGLTVVSLFNLNIRYSDSSCSFKKEENDERKYSKLPF